MMRDFNRVIDEKIRQAMKDGEFDDLPGKGKPLDLEENPYQDPAWRLASHLLRNSGYSLPWIETRREIEASLETARVALERSWDWRSSALKAGADELLAQQEWGRALQAFQRVIADLNQRIFSYNLEVPSDQFQLRKISAEKDIDRITSS
jgi:DnaJ family protein C protein 28